MNISKEELLQNLKARIGNVKIVIGSELERVGRTALQSEADISRIRKGEREHALMLRAQAIVRYKELQSIAKSPFFFKCAIAHKTIDVRHQAVKEIYFGKYELSEQGIYSWIAPIAVVRFANPGETSFKLPNGKIKEITLHEKEQYMIVDGNVMFYSHESLTHPRELIYQEHFSLKKGAFMLPEIVEVMEKAQDDVIRASHFGPFAIAGPAGSGKTTLALHRVAYLVQAPEHAELYPSHSILVFVQDAGTKEYFSHLLPELGINNVKITTFFEWAGDILKLEQVTFVQNTECELEKLILKSKIVVSEGSLKIDGVEIMWNKNIFQTLEKLYEKSGMETLISSFARQSKDRVIDRIDATIALMIFRKHKKSLQIETESNRVMRFGKIVRHTHTDVLNYSLVVVDEFQNYLPEQLSLFKSCLREETHSIIYVGDMSQKIHHGTVKTWQDFGETISTERQIMLYKVYRNTKQILRYIENLGFKVTIPDSLKEGPEVVEKVFKNSNGELSGIENINETSRYILDLLMKNSSETEALSVGVLSFDKDYISKLRQDSKLASYKNLRILTVPEAQGVEFDIVCIVGVHKDMFKLPSKYSEVEVTVEASLKANNSLAEFIQFKEEKQKIYRDLLYIALTRPMLEMHVLGTCLLEEALSI
ncbi:MAG: AAA family ATPase [Candidatus Pacebacteria bacterium]|nr:AAA family ATPase [Candidatus Paceibacterota bacterium]